MNQYLTYKDNEGKLVTEFSKDKKSITKTRCCFDDFLDKMLEFQDVIQNYNSLPLEKRNYKDVLLDYEAIHFEDEDNIFELSVEVLDEWREDYLADDMRDAEAYYDKYMRPQPKDLSKVDVKVVVVVHENEEYYMFDPVEFLNQLKNIEVTVEQ